MHRWVRTLATTKHWDQTVQTEGPGVYVPLYLEHCYNSGAQQVPVALSAEPA